jgi:saccharopine dehydrogenase-like NADP-dependent oxidoreductase
MEKHDFVQSVIKKTGLTFTDHGENFSSLWKISSNKKIRIIVAFDIHPEWVHVLCDVGPVAEYSTSISVVLLRLNSTVIGSKFSLEQNYNIVCSSEILFTHLTEDYLKQRVTQVVKMVTRFHENVEKENLKLNSA